MAKRLYDSEIHPKFEPNTSDRLAQVLRVVCGLVPSVGPFFNELISEIIPNLRQERLEKFTTNLSYQLRDLKVELGDLAQKLSPEQVALFEEGARASSRATSDEIIKRIAKVVANGLTAEQIIVDQQRRFVELLEDLSDGDFRILKGLKNYQQPTIPLLTSEEHATHDPRTEDGRRAIFALSAARKEERQAILHHQLKRLERMGLIEQPIEIGLKEQRLLSGGQSVRQIIKPKPISLTALGRIVLERTSISLGGGGNLNNDND